MNHYLPRPNPLAFLSAVLLSILAGLQPGVCVDAQNSPDYFVQTWQEEEGLPRLTISAISQTPDGYLWLATYFGLVRFDGVRFESYGADVLPELVQKQLWLLKTDRRGRLWIGTGTGGLILMEAGCFRLLDSRDGLPHTTVYSLCEDENDVMWVATGDGAISKVIGAARVERIGFLRGASSDIPIQLVRQPNGPIWFAQGDSYGNLASGLATNVTREPGTVWRLCASRDGHMWIAGNRKLFKQAAPSGQPAQSVTIPFGNYQVREMEEDRRGNLWIGTRESGLYQVRNGDARLVMPGRSAIRDIYEDAEGSLWVAAMGEGLKKVRPRVFKVLGSEQGLPSDHVSTVCEDRDGFIWAGTRAAGLVRYRPGGTLEILRDTTNSMFTSVIPDPGGGVWAGMVAGGLLHHDGHSVQRVLTNSPFKDRQLRVLLEDTRSRLWIGLFPSGLSRYGQENLIWPAFFRGLGLPNNAIFAMAEDEKQSLWLGMISGQVVRLDGEKLTAYRQEHGLPGPSVSTLHVDRENTLWVGTLGGGVGRFRDGQFKFASLKEGLRDSVIAQIVEDDQGFLWFGSARGLFRVRKHSLEQHMSGQLPRFESIPYGRSDGLLNVECVGGFQPAVWKTRAGELWFATSKGLIHFDPAALPLNTNPPPLVLEKIIVNGASVPLTGPVKLPWNHESVEFQYTALSFVAPEKVRFRRQLEGFDQHWVEAGGSRSVVYPQLRPGRYSFRVTACNNDELWNEHSVEVAFVVHPAWWQRLWVRAAGVVLIAGLLATPVRYYSTVSMRRRLARLEQAHAVEKERTRIARDIHDDVGARLTQVAYLTDLVASELPEGPNSGRLQDIAHASRQTVHALDEIVWAVNPRKDSLPHLLEYISQYANNLFRHTSIRCRQDLPAAVPDWPLSSEYRHHIFLATKEAFANIQKHSGATEIWIRVTFQAPVLEIAVEDNGTGFSTADLKPGRNGLENMQTRLAALNGTCSIASEPGRGARLLLRLHLPVPDNLHEKL